jgi:hypothetical protein
MSKSGFVSASDLEPFVEECADIGKILGALIKARRLSILKSAVFGLGPCLAAALLLPRVSHL